VRTSAGSASVSHLARAVAQPKFHRAIARAMAHRAFHRKIARAVAHRAFPDYLARAVAHHALPIVQFVACTLEPPVTHDALPFHITERDSIVE
jgi:hypothetical protein